ncbi:MAG: peroxide stress protein YaaA [Gammaproteobacteria bacterium]|nr:peroxide stress protein YaaA [Gammaproteobacteria bacterium]
MLIVISPAKKLDYDTPAKTQKFTKPDFLDDSAELITELRKYSAMDLAELMHLSMNLAELNFERYYQWKKDYGKEDAKQCLLAFKGDVYAGMDAESFSAKDLDFAQSHLRILSGLYGLLRPLDLMMPYRLEMGTRLENARGKNLYEFWGDTITNAINKQLKAQKDDILINLASNEYFKSVKPKQVEGRIITPQFKENKNGTYKMIGIYAKKARGLMSRFILLNRLKNPEDVKGFDSEGYQFNEALSQGDQWVFTR